MPRILQLKKALKVEVVGDNIFLLQFESLIDRRYAFDEGPWTFFKDLVIFKAPKGTQQATSIVFDELPIWVQCHNLPLAYMHSSILKNVGARLGKVIEVEAGEDGSCTGKYARIRIMLDISKPLRQGIWVKQEETGHESCILLRYERLSQFCGCLGHIFRDCVSPNENLKELSFGQWLRATLGGADRKNKIDYPKSAVGSESHEEHSRSFSEGSEEDLTKENFNSTSLGSSS